MPAVILASYRHMKKDTQKHKDNLHKMIIMVVFKCAA